MKNSTRLLKYILLITQSAMFQFAKGQIVYTDVNPDSTITCSPGFGDCSDSFLLDLNKDGYNDFVIINYNSFQTSRSHTYLVKVTPFGGNQIASGGLYPLVMKLHDTISAILGWNQSSDQILREEKQQTQYSYYGNWSSGSERYLGLKLIVGGQAYYGWARLIVAANGTSCTIKDFAFNNIHNQFILAGDSGRIVTYIHHIKSFSSIAISPNSFQHLTRISFSLPQTENVAVIIYDVTGRMVKVLTNETMSAGSHQLDWNATNENGNAVSAGIYFLQLQSPDFSQMEKLMVVK